MPSTYTTNLGIEKPADGEQSGTWGDTVNDNSDFMDAAIEGQVTITLPAVGTTGTPNDVDITDGTASDGRNKIWIVTDGGDLGGTAYVRLTPNDAEKMLIIRNSLSGGRDILLFQGTYNASNDVLIPNGKDMVVSFNGGGAGAVVLSMLINMYATTIETTGAATLNSLTVGGSTVSGTNTGGNTGDEVAATEGTAGVQDNSTTAEIRNKTSSKTVTPATLYTAAATVALTDQATIALNLDSGINFTLAIGGNRTLANPTNIDVGQSGFIKITQDGTGSRTLDYGTYYKNSLGIKPILTTTASAVDVLIYTVISSTEILISSVLDMG